MARGSRQVLTLRYPSSPVEGRSLVMLLGIKMAREPRETCPPELDETISFVATMPLAAGHDTSYMSVVFCRKQAPVLIPRGLALAAVLGCCPSKMDGSSSWMRRCLRIQYSTWTMSLLAHRSDHGQPLGRAKSPCNAAARQCRRACRCIGPRYEVLERAFRPCPCSRQTVLTGHGTLSRTMPVHAADLGLAPATTQARHGSFGPGSARIWVWGSAELDGRPSHAETYRRQEAKALEPAQCRNVSSSEHGADAAMQGTAVGLARVPFSQAS